MRLANGVGLDAVLWITKEWDMAVIVTDAIDDSGGRILILDMKDGTEVVSIDYSLECGRRLAFFLLFSIGGFGIFACGHVYTSH